jgi:3',5'-nucleoside bisphosphate phosphatase
VNADLHVHTTFSDGLYPPAEVVRRARAAGLDLIAITDHDTAAGVDAAVAAGRACGLRVVPGIEFSAERGRVEYHILGYGLDVHHPLIEAKVREIQQGRARRAERIVELLRGQGITLPAEKLVPPAGGVIGRMHIARLLHAAGKVSSVDEAFVRYLRRGRPAYVPHTPLDPADIIRLIGVSGGLAVWAHPKFSNHDGILPELMTAGLRGLEAYHYDHSAAERERYAALAGRHGLLVTGGSDWHGDDTRNALGSVVLPGETLAGFLAALPAAAG